MNNTSFEKTVTVEKHANYGAFRGTDAKFYKPVGEELTLDAFQLGKTYNVKGYSSESGKTNYITMILTDAPAAATSVGKRRLDVPKEELVVEENPKDDKTPNREVGRRDFKKEAKGKTLSLFIAAQLHAGKDTGLIETAEDLIQKMDEKGYF
jgi:hypothetical protein